jgi:Flp pilus assembly protein TadD/energy-coupling factor transporter ATP-binding protein EcfA2
MYKYNPGFALDETLLDSFIVRKVELELLLEVIADNTIASSNRHILVVGARGLGKTTLARTAAAVIRSDPNFAEWYPVLYGEESYGITSAGEFWLECLFHIQQQENSTELREKYRSLRSQSDDRILAESCLDALGVFARHKQRKLIVFVENINTIFDDQLTSEDGWSLRHTLQTRPDIMLFATATTYFDEIQNVDHALFEQFKVHQLTPLPVTECRKLWKYVSNEDISARQARPIQILTGGNPRLITIWAEFAANSSFQAVFRNLSNLIDEYTDYFKGQLDRLAAQERKLFVAILENWDPATTREIAEATRVPVNAASSFLGRLERRGAIARTQEAPPRWQAAERLFNIYYLMRRRGTPSSRVQALVKFMTVYYGKEQLVARTAQLAKEACRLDPPRRHDHYAAFADLLEYVDPAARETIFKSVPPEFFVGSGLPKRVKEIQRGLTKPSSRLTDIPASIRNKKQRDQARKYLKEGKWSELEGVLAKLRDVDSKPEILFLGALATYLQEKYQPAEKYIRASLDKDAERADSWFVLACILGTNRARLDEALAAAQRAAELRPNAQPVLEFLARMHAETGDLGSAYSTLRRASRLKNAEASVWHELSSVLEKQGRYKAAEVALRKATTFKSANSRTYRALGDFLMRNKHDLKGAEGAFRKALELQPGSVETKTRLARVLAHFPDTDEAVRTLYREAISTKDTKKKLEPVLAYSEYLERKGQLSEAEQELNAVKAGFREDPRLWSRLAEIAHEQNRPVDEVEAYLREAIKVAKNPALYWDELGKFLDRLPNREDEAEIALRRAVDADPKGCGPLYSLGIHFLKKDRRDEANAKFRQAIEVNPRCVCSVLALSPQANSSPTAKIEWTQYLDEVLARAPKNRAAQFFRAKRIWEVDHDYRLAKSALLNAMTLGAPSQEVIGALVDIALEAFADPKGCQIELRRALKNSRAGSAEFNVVAWRIHLSGRSELAEFAVEVAERAVDMNGNWAFKHTLAASLLDSRRFDQALLLTEELCRDASESDIPDLIPLCVDFARKGLGQRVLAIIQACDKAQILEPLCVALRTLAGEKVSVAEEIWQVAQDILAQIKEPPVKEVPTEGSKETLIALH